MCARPKGSKNRPKVSPLVEEFKEIMDGVKELPDRAGRPIGGFAIDCDKYNVPPFPENWATLSKIAKLEWLKANRK